MQLAVPTFGNRRIHHLARTVASPPHGRIVSLSLRPASYIPIRTTRETIESRRSIKHYDPEQVMPAADLAELVRLTKLTPSSLNMQNDRFVAVQDQAFEAELKAVAWDQAHVGDASVVFVTCADLNAHNIDPQWIWGHAPQPVQDILGPMTAPFYEGNERLIRDEGVRSSALAGMTLMLAAHDMDYDSCPMIGYDGAAVGKLINLPADHMVSFIIVVGKKPKTSSPVARACPTKPSSSTIVSPAKPALPASRANLCWEVGPVNAFISLS